ncbi:hypothetical protein [Desulfosporosinus sp.]|uniref:hypothetical protein n=1 Tax=Desulfosporosinus sp. TaxID=157907 RepID=UPI002311059E|nr:hypothetical protein [Desulfosporosinus sp.]MCO5385713.1 hypothetical protein [Desulfosporosinus sp.]MDA8221513.1 hypothetical protein [Desulfitobacterium hafniense]
MPDEPSDDHGWSSAPVAMDGEKGPWLTGGSVHPCTLPRMWGQSLKRKFAWLLT